MRAQYLKAKKLVLLPHWAFHRLAEKAGDPKVKVTMLVMTARCGSTLLCQMMSRVSGVLTMSEPWALNYVNSLFNENRIDSSENRRLVRSVIRLQCKSDGNGGNGDGDSGHVFMKVLATVAAQAPIISDLFPEVLLVFNTRHPRPCINSFIHVHSRSSVAMQNISNCLMSLLVMFLWRL